MIVSLRSFRETLRDLGERARQARLLRQLSQADLASRAGVGVATVVRFERSGTASLQSALRIATALGAEGGFEKLFEAPPYASLDEALARPDVAKRRRAPGRRQQ